MSWLNLLRGKQVVADPYGIVAALDARKAAGPARQEAAKRAAANRKGQGA